MCQVGRVQKKSDLLITSCSAANAIRFDGEQLPTRLKLFEWGANRSAQGEFIVNEKTAAAIAKQIGSDAFARVVIDFDHQSEKSSPTFTPSPRHHAGYGDVEVVPGDGIYLTNIEWTAKGREFAPNYQDVSPVPIYSKTDRAVLGICSVALVPNGALVGRTLFTATFNPENPAMDQEEQTPPAEAPKPDVTVTELDAVVKAAIEDTKALKECMGECMGVVHGGRIWT